MTKKQGLRLVVFIVLLGIVLNTMIGVFGFPPNDGTISIKKRFGEFYFFSSYPVKSYRKCLVKKSVRNCTTQTSASSEKISS